MDRPANQSRYCVESLQSFHRNFLRRPVEECTYQIHAQAGEGHYDDCNIILQYIQEHDGQPLAVMISEAITIIRAIMCQAALQHERVGLSFNGGKEATVVLHLVRCACLMQA